jgi:PD-(D/E)XK nuclease superfamily protein
MKDTKAKGDLTEAKILARLLEKGKVVLIPFGNNQRFDLVIYENEKFIRIQCKTARFKDGAVVFKTSSVHKNRARVGYSLKSYRGQIDLFMAYCPELNKIYSVPVDQAPEHGCNLRVDFPKQNKQLGVRWAKNFEF